MSTFPVRNSSPSRLRSRTTHYHTCNQAKIYKQNQCFPTFLSNINVIPSEIS
ncbi:hypothetical protein ACFQHW_11635 [Lapidilactobacillus achengensis]|uniref:Uncharacterized protein n=1 Tax=Lapidilactobacillus achengensis TaxID=2486000 RepID=A0ABW1UQG6_9LACO|nr:hypothetical protein [Lapidilactobacillus achengensis]